MQEYTAIMSSVGLALSQALHLFPFALGIDLLYLLLSHSTANRLQTYRYDYLATIFAAACRYFAFADPVTY